jgi:hypothetical protein
VIIRRSFCGNQVFGKAVVPNFISAYLCASAVTAFYVYVPQRRRGTQRYAEMTYPCCFGPLFGRVLSKNVAAELNPFRSNVAENNVLIDEDAIGNGEIGVQVNIIRIGQLPWHFHRLTVNLFSYSPRVLRFFGPPSKLTKPG